ncbi:MAG TPA: hypothetical protein VMG12_05795, partial [Polyangiaceae bacterium]|nr:hypothetical protein [Polyangiaceae bacterium]
MNTLVNTLVNTIQQTLGAALGRNASAVISRGLSAAEAFWQQGAGAARMLVQTQPAPPAPLADPPKVPHSDLFWMPNSASEFSTHVDTLFDFLMWVSTISLIGIAAAM